MTDDMPMCGVVVIMGVSGSGKSTVGALLAERNDGIFHDADDFHPLANISKMANGTPLNDEDRAPWLEKLRAEVIAIAPSDRLVVLACSALKKSYRKVLGVGTPGIALVYLKGDAEVLSDRLNLRAGHFMKSGMLESQLAALEEPDSQEGISVSIDAPLDEIVSSIEAALSLRFPS